MSNLLTQLSKEQMHRLYALGNRRQYGDEGVEEIVDRLVSLVEEDAPVEVAMADIRRLAHSSSSFEDFSQAITSVKERVR